MKIIPIIKVREKIPYGYYCNNQTILGSFTSCEYYKTSDINMNTINHVGHCEKLDKNIINSFKECNSNMPKIIYTDDIDPYAEPVGRGYVYQD